MLTAIITPVAIFSLWIYQNMYCQYYHLPTYVIYEALNITRFIPILMYLFILAAFFYLRYKIIQADFLMKVMRWLKIYKQDGKRPLIMEILLLCGEMVFLYQAYIFMLKKVKSVTIETSIITMVLFLFLWSFCSDPISYRLIEFIRKIITMKAGKLYMFRYTILVMSALFMILGIIFISAEIIQQQTSYMQIKEVENEHNGNDERISVIVYETDTSYIVEEAIVFEPRHINDKKELHIYADSCKYIEKNGVEIEELNCDIAIIMPLS